MIDQTKQAIENRPSTASGTEEVLRVEHLKKYFPIATDFLGRPTAYLRAVDDISFSLERGKTIGIVGESGCGKTITLKWCLINLDDNSIVEQKEMTTWGFFDGSNDKVGNMTIDNLSGSIVLYGKFGTTCTIDKLHGVENGSFEDIVAKYAI